MTTYFIISRIGPYADPVVTYFRNTGDAKFVPTWFSNPWSAQEFDSYEKAQGIIEVSAEHGYAYEITKRFKLPPAARTSAHMSRGI
jgi:hypothetical protein